MLWRQPGCLPPPGSTAAGQVPPGAAGPFLPPAASSEHQARGRGREVAPQPRSAARPAPPRPRPSAMADVEDGDEPGAPHSHPGSSGSKAGGPDKMFSLKKWNAVAMWSWDVECDTCAICRVQVMGKRQAPARRGRRRPGRGGGLGARARGRALRPWRGGAVGRAPGSGRPAGAAVARPPASGVTAGLGPAARADREEAALRACGATGCCSPSASTLTAAAA